MVDINLFKDDDEEEKNEGRGKKEKNEKEDSHKEEESLGGNFDEELSFDDEEKLGGDFDENQDMDLNLDDEFGEELDEESEPDLDKDLDKELDDVSSLDDEDFDDFENEEEIPDLEEPAADVEDKDYSFGEVKKKGPSPFLLVLLGIVVIVALGYVFVYKPKVDSLKELQSNIPEKPNVQELMEQQRKDLAAQKKDTTGGAGVAAPGSEKQTVKPGETTEKVRTAAANIQPTELAKNTGSLVNYFSQNNCLGTIIIDIKNKYFRAGYASLQPDVSDKMAEKIKTIFNTGKYEMSPEDGYRTNGERRYWGVISGELPATVISQSASPKNFNSAQSFEQWLKRTAQNNSLLFKESETFPANTESGETIIPVRVKVEGNSKNLITYLTVLLRNSGKYNVDKMIITPATINDFKGETIKFVIDLTLRT